MIITVTDGKDKKSANFREGSRVSDIIAALGFDFPMPCGGMGRCGKCRCKVDGREVLACKTQLFSDSLVEISPAAAHVLTARETVEGAEGAVLDIGTTTVAAALFREGKPVKTVGRPNPQRTYGADVISRIGAKDTAPLTAAIRALVRELRRELGENENTVITGNTAMLALLCGLNVSGMGVWPFEPPSRFDTEFEGAYLPPCVSAFVGADALCSMLRAEPEGTALMLDLGTNGEIGLFHGGRYYFTSAAAGPALEGAGISRGMAAGPGAVYRVNGGGCEVIGGGEALGVCGSGLVDAVALMLDRGILDGLGTLEQDFVLPGTDIAITQKDVRAFQLCKAAVRAGAELLISRRDLGANDVETIFLSGALGKNIDIKNAVRTGLLPSVTAEKFVPIGNGALLGGAMLLDRKNRDLIRAMAGNSECLELAADPEFVERYIDCMNF